MPEKKENNKVVVSNAHQHLGATVYERPHRRIGGRGGWRIDPVLIDHLVACFEKGASPDTACMIVGLTPENFKKWLALGNRLIAKSYETSDQVIMSDEEESYIHFARKVNHAMGMWLMLSNITLDETLRGNVDPALARIAMQILARRDPKAWESKNNVSVKNEKPQLSMEEDDPILHTKIELSEMRDAKKEERDQLVKARRNGDT